MSTSGAPTQPDLLQALEERLGENSLSGHWMPRLQPRPELQAWVWRWSTIYSCLQDSGDLTDLGKADDPNDRRTIQLVNPAMKEQGKGTRRTIGMSVQLVKPNETGEAHRHTQSALRFVVQSGGMYTTVEFEQFRMEPGDLILTPSWTWHDHTNQTNEPGIWLDVLDGLTGYLGAHFKDVWAEGPTQPILKNDGYSRQRIKGPLRAGAAVTQVHPIPYAYKWVDTLRTLEELDAAGETDPHEGVSLEYTNPLTGGPTMPAISCRIQMLRPGEMTRRFRATGVTIYHVVQGQGVTHVGPGEYERGHQTPSYVKQGEDLEWGTRDCFIVPTWRWRQLHNLSQSEPAFLFSVCDRPSLTALGIYREERG